MMKRRIDLFASLPLEKLNRLALQERCGISETSSWANLHASLHRGDIIVTGAFYRGCLQQPLWLPFQNGGHMQLKTTRIAARAIAGLGVIALASTTVPAHDRDQDDRDCHNGGNNGRRSDQH